MQQEEANTTVASGIGGVKQEEDGGFLQDCFVRHPKVSIIDISDKFIETLAFKSTRIC